MAYAEDSNFTKAYDPFLQGGVALGTAFIFMLVASLLAAAGLHISDRFPWMTATVFMLCYAVFNSVFSLSAKNIFKYWGRSMYSFLGLATFGGLLAWLFSSLTIGEAGSYKWLYMVVGVAYLVFMSMMILMRGIVDYAQKEEWHHPRIRKDKRKK